jgi:hypothetical protein
MQKMMSLLGARGAAPGTLRYWPILINKNFSVHEFKIFSALYRKE